MPKTWRALVVAGLFLLAGIVRLGAPDSTLLGERQYRSALIARYHYLELREDVAPWRMHIATLNREREGSLEPPILERVVAGLYLVAGEENLDIPRTLAVVFWLAGGFFLYGLCRSFLSFEGAAAGTAVYLFNPLGVETSVSFLPDPLMIASFVLALLALVRFHERPTGPRLATAAAAAAFTALVKPFCTFALTGAVIALAIHRRGWGRRTIDRSLLVLLAAVALPTLAYYGYGVLLKPLLAPAGGAVAPWDTLARSASVTFVPELLLTTEYWRGWARTALWAMHPAALVAALVGLPLLTDSRARALVGGLLAGYVVFGVVFTYLVPFAGHYHLQLLVVVALGVGRLVQALFEELRGAIRWRPTWALPAAAGMLVALFAARAIRDELRPAPIESPAVAREVGELIDHSDRVAVVGTYYGKPLQYHGEFFGTWWPAARGDYAFDQLEHADRSIATRLADLGFEPEYFVITDFPGYEYRHPELRGYLERRCSVHASSDAYLIYHECRPPGDGDSPAAGDRSVSP